MGTFFPRKFFFPGQNFVQKCVSLQEFLCLVYTSFDIFIVSFFRRQKYDAGILQPRTGKTTAIRRTAVREAGVSQHYGGTNEDIP